MVLEAPSSVSSSLAELANLLIVLHDNYFHVEGTSILQQLMRFLHDLNLTEQLCLLDVERIRLKVMTESREETMTYQSFYECLGEVSCLVFKKFDETGSRALNLFLTKYIIPFATREKSGSFAIAAEHSNEKYDLDDASMKVFIPYGDFLHWF